MLQLFKDFIEESGWRADINEKDGIVVFPMKSDNSQFICVADIKNESNLIVFYSICSVHAPEVKRLLLAEFLMRINYGRMIGNFEMDFDDGEIRYKTSLDYEDTQLTLTTIKNLVNANISSMDRVTPLIFEIIYGNLTAENASERFMN